jgi:hypothetical protein
MRKAIFDGVEREIVFYRIIQQGIPSESWIAQFIIKEIGTGKELFIHEESGSGFFPHTEYLYDCLTVEFIDQEGVQ